MNGVYIREHARRGSSSTACSPWLEAPGSPTAADVAARREWFARLAPLVSERVKRLDEVAPMVALPLRRAGRSTRPRARRCSRRRAPGRALDAAAEALAHVRRWTPTAIEAALRDGARDARAQAEGRVPGGPRRGHGLDGVACRCSSRSSCSAGSGRSRGSAALAAQSPRARTRRRASSRLPARVDTPSGRR